MSLRLHELHPSLVHLPLALLPASVALDAIGFVSDREAPMTIGKYLMAAAAAGAAAAGAAGLVAQEAVRARGDAHDLLVTHRNLNAGLVVLTVTLAALRLRRTRPSAGYLLAGCAGVAVMNYTAYLGGKMVYSKGVGVAPAGGVRAENAPEIRRDNLWPIARTSASYVAKAVKHAARHIGRGEFAPTLQR